MEDSGQPIKAVVRHKDLLHDVELSLETKEEKAALDDFRDEHSDFFSRGAHKLFRMARKSPGCRKKVRWLQYILFFSPQDVSLKIYVEGKGFEEVPRGGGISIYDPNSFLLDM